MNGTPLVAVSLANFLFSIRSVQLWGRIEGFLGKNYLRPKFNFVLRNQEKPFQHLNQ
jgi:hypothetical protein